MNVSSIFISGNRLLASVSCNCFLLFVCFSATNRSWRISRRDRHEMPRMNSGHRSVLIFQACRPQSVRLSPPGCGLMSVVCGHFRTAESNGNCLQTTITSVTVAFGLFKALSMQNPALSGWMPDAIYVPNTFGRITRSKE